jgi:amino acid transporter
MKYAVAARTRARMVKRLILAIVAFLACIAVVDFLSWRQTSWYGAIPEREWSLCVQDSRGKPLIDANVTLLSRTGEPLFYSLQDPVCLMATAVLAVCALMVMA